MTGICASIDDSHPRVACPGCHVEIIIHEMPPPPPGVLPLLTCPKCNHKSTLAKFEDEFTRQERIAEHQVRTAEAESRRRQKETAAAERHQREHDEAVERIATQDRELKKRLDSINEQQIAEQRRLREARKIDPGGTYPHGCILLVLLFLVAGFFISFANVWAGASVLNLAFVIWMIAHFDYRLKEIRNVLMDRLPPDPPEHDSPPRR